MKQTVGELTADQQKLQQEILKSGNGSHAYFFARKFKGADVEALQQVIFDKEYLDGAEGGCNYVVFDGQDVGIIALYSKSKMIIDFSVKEKQVDPEEDEPCSMGM